MRSHWGRAFAIGAIAAILAAPVIRGSRVNAGSRATPAYLGFDANDYPGDTALPVLRRIFSFAGYWLSQPPGGAAVPWLGKRALLLRDGFGFLVLFNGRLERDLKNHSAPLNSVPPMRRLPSARPSAKASIPARSFFSIRRRAAKWSPTSWLTFLPGSMA